MMQSNQASPGTPTSEEAPQESSSRKKNLSDTSTDSVLSCWHRTGAIASTAITLAAGSTLHLHGVAQAQATPSDNISDAAATEAIARNDDFIESLQPQISPTSLEQLQFSQPISTADIKSDSESATDLAAQGTTANSSGCETLNCLEIEAVDDKLPELNQQVQALRTQLQDFEAQHSPKSLEAHQAILTHRTVGLANQKSELGKQLSDVELQLLELQEMLAAQPYQETFVSNLLQDARYQDRLDYLRQVDREIAFEYSQLELDESKLESLYSQYNQISEHLFLDAQNVLDRYLAIAQDQVSPSLWQEPMYHTLLQRWVDTSHEYQLLSQRQETFDYMESLLQEHHERLQQLRQSHISLQRQLDRAEQVLQSYVVKRAQLETALNPSQETPSTTISAQQASVNPTQIWSIFARLPQKQQNEIALAILMGAGILTALSLHRRQDTLAKNDPLALPHRSLDIIQKQPFNTSNSLTEIFEAYSEEGFEVFAAIGTAIVLYAFRDTRTTAIELSEQLVSEIGNFKRERITLSPFGNAAYEEQPIKIALYGMELEEEAVWQDSENMDWNDLYKIFGSDNVALAA